MKQSLFEPQLNEIEKVLRKYSLLRERWYPTLPEHLASTFRHLSYKEVWEKCYENRYFHFLLSDYSMLLFRIDYNGTMNLSYSFIDCPITIISYTDFLLRIGETVENVGDTYYQFYEEELAMSPSKESVVPLRYDYDENGYRSGVHPVSHFHFGHESNIRLGTELILQPVSFVLFVLRQFYPNIWTDFINNNANAPILCRRIRSKLDSIDNTYLGTKDYWELFLK